jgi:two-component system, OmpR family, alkaline phosphatase synthesis response regulator PhoP
MPRRILIVDDEDDIREVAQLCLEVMGDWEVTAASSGQQALQIAPGLQPEVILMDVMMPELDGPSTCKLLQQDEATRSIPVILLTAKVQASDRMHFDALGVAGVIAKPFDPLTLASEIDSRLAQK